MHRRYLAALLVLSGFCGLAYELIWVRMLSLSFGSTTLSFSTVIAVFLGGLALGSWLCGRSARALANPIRTYALLELGAGIVGLALYPVLKMLPDAFSFIDPGAGAAGVLARLAISIVILLPPTLLMGATLPVACAACIHTDAKLGAGAAILYGLNTLGACLGTYCITFVLFPLVGLSGAVLVTVGLNIFVGTTALLLDRLGVDVVRAGSGDASSSPGVTPDVSDARDPGVVGFASLLAFLLGFSAVSVQVAWSRLFSIFLDGTIYAVGSVLVAVLVGIGVGSLVVSRRLVDPAQAARVFLFSQVLLVLSLLLFWSTLPITQYTLQTLVFGMQGLSLVHAQLLLVVLALALPTATSGAALPILIRVITTRAQGVPSALGGLYAANTAGSVVGSLATGFVLLPVLGTAGVAYLTTILVVIGAVLASVRLLRDQGPARFAYLPVLVLAVAVFPDVDAIRMVVQQSAGMSFWEHAEAARVRAKGNTFFREGQIATVLVTSNQAKTVNSLSLNGLGQGTYQQMVPHHILESLLVAQVPLLHTRRADNALVVGLGAGATVDAMVELGVGHVRVLELEPAVAEAAPIILGDRSKFFSSRVDVVVDDARHYLLVNRRSPLRYDTITSMPAHPWVAANIFTREFFELARENLTDEGVFTTWFGKGRMDDELFTSLYSAFTQVFPHHIIYDVNEVGALFLVGSRSPLQIDPRRLAELATNDIIRAQTAPLGDLSFYTTRVLTSGVGRAPAPRDIVNTDGSLFAETRGPLVGTSTRGLTHLVDTPGLAPEILPPDVRVAELTEMIEQALATPGGRVPLGEVQPRLTRATELLAAARNALPDEHRRYFEARIAATRGDASSALATLRQLATSSSSIGIRADAFAVILNADPAARRAELARLVSTRPVGSDIWIRALDGPAHDAAVRAAAGSTTTDPLGWMIAAAYGPSPPPLHDVAELFGRLGRESIDSRAMETCTRAAERAGLPDLLAWCQASARRTARRESLRLVTKALRSARDEKFDEAVEAFAEAAKTEPLEAPQLELYLRTAVYANADQHIDAARRGLRLLGVPAALVEGRVLEARTRREALEEAPTSDTSP